MNKLDELDRLEKAATGGPWVYDDGVHYSGYSPPEQEDPPSMLMPNTIIEMSTIRDVDGELIATMRNNIRALIDVARAAEALAKRHYWHPGMGQCVCQEHKEFYEALEMLQK